MHLLGIILILSTVVPFSKIHWKENFWYIVWLVAASAFGGLLMGLD